MKREDSSEDQIVTTVSSGDAPYYAELAKKFAEITGLKDGPESERGAGAFSEWAYYHFGRISLSVPVWWPPSVEQRADTTGENPVRGSEKDSPDKGSEQKNDPLKYQKRLLHWLRYAGRERDFKEWKSIEHPDFPDQKVEIGGFLPHITVNPPADSLPVLAHMHSRFLLFLAGLMPRIDLVSKVESVHDNVYRITAVVRNTGFLPTNTDLGTRIRWIRKVKAGIELGENMQLLSGRKFTLVGSLPGGGGSVEISWLVLGERGAVVKLYAGCPMTGQREEKITLK